MLRWLLCSALLGTAAPVSATVIFDDCTYSNEVKRFVEEGAASDAKVQRVIANPVGKSFASWRAEDLYGDGDGSAWWVLQNCAGQEDLIAVARPDNRQVALVYDQMVYGTQPFTLRQIGEALTSLGASVRLTNTDFGDCPCVRAWGS